MWIREIDFPAPLIDAHRAGELVIFVGAGVSRDAPANLPDFRTLTCDIAAEAAAQVTKSDLDRPDVFLGRLADRQVDVHRRVAAHIGVSTSKPNRLHNGLIDLAMAGPTVRIVTTNYDLHLSTALGHRGAQLEEYVAPALPMGDDFTGLVYLHGNLRQKPHQLVVTDRDFGRAYLRDAWAARFLERMFATYTVLFVGYSHGDLVMRYMERALERGGHGRYLLTAEPQEPDWPALDIVPVGYPITNGSHAALVDAIEGWGSQASMGLLDHRQQIANFVSSPPSQVPEETSYLEATVADRDRVRLFADLARGEEWLRWAATQPEFRRLFDPSVAPTECSWSLSYWFAEHFVMDEVLTGAALSLVRDAGGRIGRTVWLAIAHRLHVQGSPRPDWLMPWVVLLIENAPDVTAEWLDYALVESRWPEDRSEALLLFDYLTEPQALMGRSFVQPGAVRFEVQLRGSSYWLDEAWGKLFAPNLPEAAPALLAVAERHLRRAHQLLAATGSAVPGWDPVSFRRSAIDPHPQDQHREPVDALIDAARDCLEALLKAGDSLGVALLDAWAVSEVPILRRLSVYGWVCRTDVDGTAKIAWLREREWLFDHQLHHEVFRLIEVALPSAAAAQADALVADVMTGPESHPADADYRVYEQFNALAWITRHTPDLQSAREALEQIQAENPQLAVREHPDLLSTIEVGFIPPRPPMTASELHQRIATDAAGAVSDLRTFEGVNSSPDGPTWSDAVSVLVETVRDDPTDGFAVLDATGGDTPDIVRSVISGWSMAAVDAAMAEKILQRLAHVDLNAVAEDIAQLLANSNRGDSNPTEWHRFPAARSLAADLWSAIDTSPTPTDNVDDWLSLAIGSAAGRIALFWVNVIAADWRIAGDGWAGLPSEIRARLELMLASQDARSAMAEIVLSSHALFFFTSDRTWSETNILPLLNWAYPMRARRTWDGYLIWGRWNDQLLNAGLLEGYLAAAAHLTEFREELRQQLCSHLAAVALHSDVDPIPWMRTFTATVDLDHRVEWMSQVAWMLSEMPADAVEYQWQRWMRPYWQDRIDSIPIDLSDAEASALATWVVYLTASICDGVNMATAHPAGLGQHMSILDDLDKNRLNNAPTELARLIAHLMQGTQPPFWGCHQLATIVPELRNGGAPAHIKVIVEEALRLGCNDAAQW